MPRPSKSAKPPGTAYTTSRRVIGLDAAVARLREELDEWQRRALKLRKLVDGMLRDMGLAVRSLGSGRDARALIEQARRGRRAGAGARAAEILREWGRPARAGELLPEIQRRGVPVGGRNPLATLASTLLKYPGVKRVSRGLFAAADTNGGESRRGRKAGARRAQRKGSKEVAGSANPEG